MERAHCVHVDLHSVHLGDKSRDQLHQLVQLLVSSPVVFADYISEEVTIVRDAHHSVRELSVAKDLRLTRRILIRQEDLKAVTSELILYLSL